MEHVLIGEGGLVTLQVPPGYVGLTGATLEKTTERAICVAWGAQTVWFPKAAVHPMTPVVREGDSGVVVVTSRIATEKGLLPGVSGTGQGADEMPF